MYVECTTTEGVHTYKHHGIFLCQWTCWLTTAMHKLFFSITILLQLLLISAQKKKNVTVIIWGVGCCHLEVVFDAVIVVGVGCYHSKKLLLLSFGVLAAAIWGGGGCCFCPRRRLLLLSFNVLAVVIGGSDCCCYYCRCWLLSLEKGFVAVIVCGPGYCCWRKWLLLSLFEVLAAVVQGGSYIVPQNEIEKPSK